MSNYTDAYVFPIPKEHIHTYKNIASKVAEIWKEHGALSYREFVQDDFNMKGTVSFEQTLNSSPDQVIIVGFVEFTSKEACELTHKKVFKDPRMSAIVGPIMQPGKMIFDPSKMVYGRFNRLF